MFKFFFLCVRFDGQSDMSSLELFEYFQRKIKIGRQAPKTARRSAARGPNPDFTRKRDVQPQATKWVNCEAGSLGV